MTSRPFSLYGARIAGFAFTFLFTKLRGTKYGENPVVKESEENTDYPFAISAPAKGRVVPMEQIPDETFASELLGLCIQPL